MIVSKKILHRDVLLSTILTFALLWLVRLLVINIEYLNPLMQVLDDFQFTDLYYSQFKSQNVQLDTNIVIVNIGENDRAGIAREIGIIEKYNPEIIGLDVLFKDKKDAVDDSILKNTLHGPVKVVSVSMITYGGDEKLNGSARIENNNSFFGQQKNEGFGSFLSEEDQTVRYFTPFLKLSGTRYPSFVTKIIEDIDPAAYKKLLNRGRETEIINYQTNNFVKLDIADLNGTADLSFLKNKIVLMGYMGPDLAHKVFEDNHLTPLNKRYGGHTLPDKYGIEIHANILSMILHNDYVTEVPKWAIYIMAFLVCMMHMYFFIYMFVTHHKWFHTGALALQIFSFGALVILSLFIFHLFRLKLEPTFLLMGVLLSVESLYFYDDLAKYMNSKFKFRTCFKQHH